MNFYILNYKNDFKYFFIFYVKQGFINYDRKKNKLIRFIVMHIYVNFFFYSYILMIFIKLWEFYILIFNKLKYIKKVKKKKIVLKILN